MGRKTICSSVNEVASELIHSNELTRLMQPQNYCGILLIDGKFLPVKYLEKEGKEKGLIPVSKKRRGRTKGGLVEISFVDYQTHDIPVHIIANSENMYDIEQGFLKLKEMGYPLLVVVCDESMGEIAQVAKKIFPNVIIQLCLKHYSENIDRCFIVNQAKRKLKSFEKKLSWIGDSIFISSRHQCIERARVLTNQMADLEYEYMPLIQVQSIFQDIFHSKSEEEVLRLEDELNESISTIDLDHYKHGRKIKDRYQNYYEKRGMILASVLHSDLYIPRTTNLVEGFHSTTLEMRLNTIRGFEHEKTAKNYLNALILYRRFKKFTDCRKPFKHLNKKSPLEISQPKNLFGFQFGKDDWISFCRKLKKEPPK